MKYKNTIDYEQTLNSVADRLEEQEEFVVENIKVSGSEVDNNLELTCKLLIDDYLMSTIAKYIIDGDEININIEQEFNGESLYKLSQDDIIELNNFNRYLKKLMEI